MANTDAIRQALALSKGARFYHCALQVNPFEYVIRHSKKSQYADEASYNTAMVKALLDQGIEVIAITDHYRVQTAKGMAQAAREAGIHVFPGFEAVTKDGIHLLCLFDPNREVRELDRILGDCGIHRDEAASPTGKYDATEFLKAAANTWGAVCVAAHVASEGGLLNKLSGQTGINTWRDPDLCACALPGPVCDAPNRIRQILENKNADYRRERLVAIINAQDISSPEDVSKPGASCWIKMSEVSVEGLRQAFLDPTSRIRLTTDPKPEDHEEFLALSWQGGFLDGASLHFNENLNVLIGGRGTGKSTVVESLRYVLGLDPVSEDAKKAHEGIVKHVLRNGTKISLLVRTHKPSQRDYLIERTIPNPAVLRDATGTVLNLSPRDVVPQVEVYGQHEISELTKSREKLTRLLERFVERDSRLDQRKRDLQSELETTRSRVVELQREHGRISERLAALPALEETLRRFQEAGIENRLKEQSLLVKEEKVLKTASEKLEPFRSLVQQLQKLIPVDRSFLSSEDTKELPGKEIFAGADPVLEQFDRAIQEVVTRLTSAIKTAEDGLASVKEQWQKRESVVKEQYEKVLRELQKSKVDGEEFIQLRRQIEELHPLRNQQGVLTKKIEDYLSKRRNFLTEWEDVKTQEFRELENAAKKVNRKLKDRVRVSMAFAGNRKPLGALLREEVGGRLAEAIDVLERRDDLSLPDLASAIRSGKDALSCKYSIVPAQADKIAQADPTVVMKIEELDLPSTTKIELNVAPEGESPEWQTLEELSTGQKATAVLLLLLLESDAPLVVDQPEDDLDNRFITEGVVPRIKEEKRRRQFVFTTHNANIPVLGDAELIIGLTASGEGGHGKAKIPKEHMGSIDALPVRELIEEVLEGGRDAFEMRRKKYGF
jgi:DNA repair ATPase RecN